MGRGIDLPAFLKENLLKLTPTDGANEDIYKLFKGSIDLENSNYQSRLYFIERLHNPIHIYERSKRSDVSDSEKKELEDRLGFLMAERGIPSQMTPVVEFRARLATYAHVIVKKKGTLAGLYLLLGCMSAFREITPAAITEFRYDIPQTGGVADRDYDFPTRYYDVEDFSESIESNIADGRFRFIAEPDIPGTLERNIYERSIGYAMAWWKPVDYTINRVFVTAGGTAREIDASLYNREVEN